MSKTKKPKGGWARYPKELGSVRITEAMHADLERVCDRDGLRVADYVRGVLGAALDEDAAQSGSQSDARSAKHG